MYASISQIHTHTHTSRQKERLRQGSLWFTECPGAWYSIQICLVNSRCLQFGLSSAASQGTLYQEARSGSRAETCTGTSCGMWVSQQRPNRQAQDLPLRGFEQVRLLAITHFISLTFLGLGVCVCVRILGNWSI